MISLATAKFLLFVALCLGPQYGDSNHTIQITDNRSYIVWTENPQGWTIAQKSYASYDWPVNGTFLSTQDLNQFSKENRQLVREISKHDWRQNSLLHLANGDIAEKRGNQVFYTINAGGYNQQVFTIQTLQNGRPF